MSTKITTCPKCSSRKVTELNPQVRHFSTSPIVTISGRCDECNHTFTFPTWTSAGKRRGIRY